MIAWIASWLRRLRDERVSAIGLGGLVLVTAFAASAAPRVSDRLAVETFQATFARAQPVARNIQFLREDPRGPVGSDPIATAIGAGTTIDNSLPSQVRDLISARAWTIDSGRYSLPEVVGDKATMRLRIQPDAQARLHLDAGRWPTGSITTAPDRTSSTVPPADTTFFEVALATPSAKLIGVTVGDTLMLTPDLTDPLIRGRTEITIGVTIVGTYSVVDPADPWWLGGTELAAPSKRYVGNQALVTDTEGLLSNDASAAFIDASNGTFRPLRLTFRDYVDPTRLSAGDIDSTLVELRRMEATYPFANVTVTQPIAMRTGLPGILEGYLAQWTSATAILTVVAIGAAAVAAAALALIALLAGQRRRSALALARGRGASGGHLVVALLTEGALLTAIPVGLGVALAFALIPEGPLLPSVVLGIVAEIVALSVIVLASLSGTSILAAGSARDAAPPRRPTARRLLLESFVVVLAIGGLVLLRDRGLGSAGSTGSTGSTGQASGADPLLAAVPALVGIAAGLIAMRLIPLPVGLLARLAHRRRDLVPLLAFRHAAQAAVSAPVLIVLLATMAVAAFSATILIHLDRAADVVAWREVGAAFRIDGTPGSLPAVSELMAIPGVENVASAYRSPTTIGPHVLQASFVAIDARAYQQVTSATPAQPDLPDDLTSGNPSTVPIVVSTAIASRPEGVSLGDTFTVAVDGCAFPARVVAVADPPPALTSDTLAVLASGDQVKALCPTAALPASTEYLRVPESALPDAQAALARSLPIGTRLTDRSAVALGIRDSPAVHAVVTGIALAVALTAVYAALAFIAALALAGKARGVEVAHLRTLGLTIRQAAAIVVVEHGPIVVVALVGGIAVGVGLVLALPDALGLDALVGSPFPVPPELDPGQLGLVVVAIVAVVGVGLAFGAAFQRSEAPLGAIRRGFE